jgi:hypothetical protein
MLVISSPSAVLWMPVAELSGPPYLELHIGQRFWLRVGCHGCLSFAPRFEMTRANTKPVRISDFFFFFFYLPPSLPFLLPHLF